MCDIDLYEDIILTSKNVVNQNNICKCTKQV